MRIPRVLASALDTISRFLGVSILLARLSKVIHQGLKKAWKPLIPLRPVVAARRGVKFVKKISFCEQCREFAAGWQQAILFTARKEEIRRHRWIRGSRKDKGIIIALRNTSPGSEDGSKAPPLLKPLD